MMSTVRIRPTMLVPVVLIAAVACPALVHADLLPAQKGGCAWTDGPNSDNMGCMYTRDRQPGLLRFEDPTDPTDEGTVWKVTA